MTLTTSDQEREQLLLLREISSITQSFNRVKSISGEAYNLFSILDVRTDEVGTHSRFMAHLLDPRETHGMGTQFLRAFPGIDQIGDFRADQVRVETEYYVGPINKTRTEGGRIDILVQIGSKYLLIENKIYASDQSNQLLRYRNAFPDALIYYLTLYGDGSTDADNKGVSYECLSYADSIIEWLEDCQKLAYSKPLLRETIAQYINLIKDLTNQNANSKMTEAIISKILENDASFEAFAALNKVQDKLRNEVFYSKVLPLFRSLARKHEMKLTLNYPEKDFFRFGNKYKRLEFSNELTNSYGLSIGFELSRAKGYSNLIFGLKFKRVQKEILIREKLIESFKQEFHTANGPNHSWLMYKAFKGYENWEDFEVLQKLTMPEFEVNLDKKLERMLRLFKDL